jgi:pSer/pThr/pTyr-binding forkhead associated (FHA) protein
MTRLIVKPLGGQPAEAIALKPGINRFGRGVQNHHVIDHSEVSESHCEILVEGEFVFVRDLESSNGTFIDGDLVKESALYSGQTLRIGLLEMVLEMPEVRVAIPELPKPELLTKAKTSVMLADGHLSCLNHSNRHAVWKCFSCERVYCDECIRKLRRVGGIHLKLCPACSTPCNFTAWSEMMRKKRKGFFGNIVNRITDGLKRTTTKLTRPPSSES